MVERLLVSKVNNKLRRDYTKMNMRTNGQSTAQIGGHTRAHLLRPAVYLVERRLVLHNRRRFPELERVVSRAEVPFARGHGQDD